MNHENIWAPWRMAYLRDLKRKADDIGWDDLSAGNFLAHYWEHPELDEKHHVIERTDVGIILLNRYPYANGHLLIALGEARPALLDYSSTQRAAFWALVDRAVLIVEKTLNPQGINLGVNQGRAAGAGVPEHLHAHIVPRWAGDTNFLSVVGNVRVMPDSLEEMAGQYRATAKALNK